MADAGGKGRILGIAGAMVALLVAVVVLAVLLLGGESYKVTAQFVSASQLVQGNLVTVAGEEVGKVEDIDITDDGQAKIEMTISDEAYRPLRRGTRATVRQRSLSGVANRYVELHLGGADQPEIADGGTIEADDTESAVDLDQLFNLFDPVARAAVSKSVDFFRDINAGRADEAQAALRYLNPALSSSSRLFAELNRNTDHFERFIVETSRLVTDLSDRDDALAGLISNLAQTTDALADRRGQLGDSIELLPDFMRRSNTTFVNLRAALDDLDPLVDDAKPIVADQLIPLFDELRPFARDAEPTVRDLSQTIRRPGAGNDLVELLRAQPAVDRIANQSAERNGAERPGAFAETQRALNGVGDAKGASDQLSFLRPYSVDLIGWFDDFSTSGAYDALGGFSRSGLGLNAFTAGGALGGLLPVPPELRTALLGAGLSTGRNSRCPGSVERTAPDSSNPYVPPSVQGGCDPSQRPIGP